MALSSALGMALSVLTFQSGKADYAANREGNMCDKNIESCKDGYQRKFLGGFVRSLVPHQGSNLCPLKWKRRVLTTDSKEIPNSISLKITKFSILSVSTSMGMDLSNSTPPKLISRFSSYSILSIQTI